MSISLSKLGVIGFTCALSVLAHTRLIAGGPLASYPFKGSSADESGNSYNGTAANVLYAPDRFGRASNAVTLQGDASSFVTINTTALNLNPPFTLSAWVKIGSAVSGRIFSTSGYELAVNSGHVAMNVADAGNAGASTQAPSELSFGEWHQIVGVWTTNGGTLYTDGVVMAAYTTTLHPDYSRGFIPTIGRNSGSNADSLQALVDDLRIYSREFSSKEVNQLFSAESEGLIAYYPFSGGVTDETASGHDAVVHGAMLAMNRFGIEADSYSLSGGAYIETGSAVGFPALNEDFTISLWLIFPDPFVVSGAGVQIIFANREIDQFQLALNPTSPTSGFVDYWTGGDHGPPADCHSFTVRWGIGEWHNLVIRRSSDVITIYLDQTLIGQSQTAHGNNASLVNRKLDFGYRVSPQACCPFRGQMDDIRIYNRALSDTELQELYIYEGGPRLALIKAVKPSFSYVRTGTNYQLQSSTDLKVWRNEGAVFSATNSSMVYPQYWDVTNWGGLFFRLRVQP